MSLLTSFRSAAVATAMMLAAASTAHADEQYFPLQSYRVGPYAAGGNARYVWSYGHRNLEGLAFDSRGRLWEAELGNSIMDELNLIRKGANYGWPACEGTSGACGDPAFTAPVQTWPPTNPSL